MKILYLECNMGAAGDMLMSALYELCDQKERFLEKMNQVFAPDIKLTPLSHTKNGIMGTQIQILIHGEEEHVYEHIPASKEQHHHHGLSYLSILEKINTLDLPDLVKENALAVYQTIGNAEASVHGTSLEQIHFHEVGTLDALVDVVGCSYLFYLLAPEKIICSPIHVGSGFVRCAHGVLPVPAPATAEILKGIPYYSGSISSELCTPTGAALIKHFVDDFGTMPPLTVSATGYGMGHKDFSITNCLRAFLGTSFVSATPDPTESEKNTKETSSFCDDTILEISCNLDDMTGESLGFVTELLLEKGALDTFTIPIQMKKNRPASLLVCFCEPTQKETFTELIFKHTTTRGVRYQTYERAKLESSFYEKDTIYGAIRMKKSSGYHVTKEKPEFEDVKAAALCAGCSIQDVLSQLTK